LQYFQKVRQTYYINISKTHHSCYIFFFLLSLLLAFVLQFSFFVLAPPSKPCGAISIVVAFALLMSKSGGAALKVISLLGGPHEHAGLLPEIFSGLARSPMRSTRSFHLLFGSLAYKTHDLNLSDSLVVTALTMVVAWQHECVPCTLADRQAMA
jgi:hypothetical protein